jgi:hypothetical protein
VVAGAWELLMFPRRSERIPRTVEDVAISPIVDIIDDMSTLLFLIGQLSSPHGHRLAFAGLALEARALGADVDERPP